MKRLILFACLALSLVSCSPRSAVTTVASVAASDASSAVSQKWEYLLDRIMYGPDCAKEVFAIYKDNAPIQKAGSFMHGQSPAGTGGHMDIASLWVFSALPDMGVDPGAVDNILVKYDACGSKLFGDRINAAGDQGWEMISQRSMTYISQGDQTRQNLEIGYGYEVMWKRPKS